METYQIYPIKVSEFIGTEKSNFTYQKDQGKKINAPVIVYLIRGHNQNILVDTGCATPVWCAKYHHVTKQTKAMELPIALQKFGLAAKDIKTVINTHLHWDHCFNNYLFTNAKIYVQKREVEFAKNPFPTQYTYYEATQLGLTPPWQKNSSQMVMVEGDYALADGIKLITTPGHTPGFQSVLVNTTQGVYGIASDTVGMLENWEEGTHGLPTPSGIFVSLYDYYASFKKLQNMCQHVLPGHDERVFAHAVYPY